MMLIEFSLIDLNLWPSFLFDNVVHPVIMIILCLLSVFVVLGNIIVVTAIWHEHQLHSVTNYLIASLAAADCLVGLVVMPFSIISEIILGSWTFGPTWCDLWHSFDVLASTASIMNLCAISLDRYLAITKPISYQTKMTPRRVALLILSLWTCSALISFPAILWWHAVGQDPLQQFTPSNSAMISMHNQSPITNQNPSNGTSDTFLYRCVFPGDTYYLLFSSFVSFYGPLCVMLYAYYRIYTAAVQQTRFLKYGSKQVMIGKKSKRHRYVSEHVNQVMNEKTGQIELNCDGLSNIESYDRQHLVLRAHRGGGGGTTIPTSNSSSKSGPDLNPNNNQKQSNLSVEDCNKSSLNDANNPRSNIKGSGENETQPTKSDLANLNRENSCHRTDRINMALEKRDKMRIDTQRFDLAPKNLNMSVNAGSARMRHLVQISNKELKANRDMGKKERHKNPFQSRFKATNSLMATINQQTNAVEVSIVSQNRSGEDIRYTDPDITKNYVMNELEGRHRSNDKPSNVGGKNSAVFRDYDASDEFCGSESTGSSSYGTGSISSILVRPQYPSAKVLDSKKSCDTSDGHSSQFKMRRALSVDDVEQRWPDSSGSASARMTSNEESCQQPSTRDRTSVVMTTDGKHSTSLLSNDRHRASYSNSLGANMVNHELLYESARTLDIRSWVNMARARSTKKQNLPTVSDRQDNLMKPPASLVPLMMMNSDTSTDSSIVMVEARKIETIHEAEHDEKNRRMKSNDTDNATCRVNFADLDRESITKNRRKSKPSSVFKKAASLECAFEHEKKCLAKRRSSSGAANIRHNRKLYHDSDKLIQSIVDLRAMHYIDCSNQITQNHTDIVQKGSVSLTNASDASMEVVEMKSMNMIKQNHSAKTTQSRSNDSAAPRQRSVGKKLNKLRKERKAAKTLGIVVGVFILCWLPFFVVNIIVALCGTSCIYKPQLILSIVTWLGWINSAMNPVIYACWSRDFRRAFRRVLCTWVEFLCLYDGSKLAKKLGLKKGSNYSNAQEIYLNRTSSSTKGFHNTSVSYQSGGGVSSEATVRLNGNVHRSLLSDAI